MGAKGSFLYPTQSFPDLCFWAFYRTGPFFMWGPQSILLSASGRGLRLGLWSGLFCWPWFFCCSAFAVVSFCPFRWLALVFGASIALRDKLGKKKGGRAPQHPLVQKMGGNETTSSQSARESVTQSAGQPVSQQVSQPISQAFSPVCTQPASQAAPWNKTRCSSHTPLCESISVCTGGRRPNVLRELAHR